MSVYRAVYNTELNVVKRQSYRFWRESEEFPTLLSLFTEALARTESHALKKIAALWSFHTWRCSNTKVKGFHRCEPNKLNLMVSAWFRLNPGVTCLLYEQIKTKQPE